MMKKIYLFLLSLGVLGTNLFAQPVSDANGTTAEANNASTLTISGFSVPANNNRLLVVCTYNGLNAPAPSVTFNGNAMTVAIQRQNSSGVVLGLHYIVLGSDVSATTGDIVATGSGIYRIGAASYHDVDQTTPTGGETSNIFSGSPTSNTLTVTSATNELVCDCIGATASGFTGFNVGANQTQIFQSALVPGGLPNAIAMSTEAGAASVDMSWTINGSGSFIGVHAGMGLKPVGGVVPVKWTYFKGQPANKGIQLFWQTASETNNAGFEIHRSSDGRTWEKRGFIEGFGTTSKVQNYSWTDEQPLTGMNYYRLKQQDYDGRFEYSDVISVRLVVDGSHLAVRPNPVQSGEVTLYFPETNFEEAHLEIFNSMGNLVQTERLPSNETTIQTSHLPKGIYWFSVRVNGQIMIEKVVIW